MSSLRKGVPHSHADDLVNYALRGGATGGITPTNAFLQNGNSFGATATLGTNDAFPLAFETSGVERSRFDLLGNSTLGGLAPAFASAAGTRTFSIQGAVGVATGGGVLELVNPTTTAAAGDDIGRILFLSPDSGSTVPGITIAGDLAGAGPNFGTVLSILTKQDGSNTQNSLIMSQTGDLVATGDTSELSLTLNGGGATAASSGSLILTNAKAVAALEDLSGTLQFRQNAAIALPGNVAFIGAYTSILAPTSGGIFFGIAQGGNTAGAVPGQLTTSVVMTPGLVTVRPGGNTTSAVAWTQGASANPFRIEAPTAVMVAQTWVLPVALPIAGQRLTALSVAAPTVVLTWAA